MQRRFIDLTSDQITALLEADALPLFGHSRSIDWEELLRSPRVTIISEAGSGKTYECQTQQRRLFIGGEPAFFFELSELARFDDTASLLRPEEQSRFQVWQHASDQVATFFLDAYDELKLTRGKFRTALTRLRSFVGAEVDRMRLVVTSRPVPFESEMLGQLFPLTPPANETRAFVDDVMGTASEVSASSREEKAAPLWRTVCLMPLDEPSIRAFVADQGLADVDAFVDDLRDRDAFDFARRPQDLIELCQDWRDHRRIRAHRDQVETNVVLKLKPRTDRDEAAQLSETKAREGAGTLALAALLMKSLTIRHSAEAQGEDVAEPAIDPARLLQDWPQDERRTLIERPLFSYASYGRVRFHHRSVLEFLAAERLHALLKAGMSRRAVKRLLFARTAHGVEVVRPSLRPAAAWLALLDAYIFAEICRREPEVLICLGDPSLLSIEQRNSVLTAFANRNRDGTWRGLRVPGVQTQRFADPTLGATVRGLWDTRIENGEMREFLLELAANAPLSEMADPAADVFLDKTAPDTERLGALRAILALNDPRLPEIVATMAREPTRWSNRLLGYAIIELFPHYMFGDDLRSLLLVLRPSKSSIDAITWNWPELIKDSPLSPAAATELRQMLHDLVLDGARRDADLHHLQALRGHLVPALAATCLKELGLGNPSADWMDAAVAAIRFFTDDEYDEDRPVGSLRRAISSTAPAARLMKPMELAAKVTAAVCSNCLLLKEVMSSSLSGIFRPCSRPLPPVDGRPQRVANGRKRPPHEQY